MGWFIRREKTLESHYLVNFLRTSLVNAKFANAVILGFIFKAGGQPLLSHLLLPKTEAWVQAEIFSGI